jgi:hypothetical protein
MMMETACIAAGLAYDGLDKNSKTNVDKLFRKTKVRNFIFSIICFINKCTLKVNFLDF